MFTKNRLWGVSAALLIIVSLMALAAGLNAVNFQAGTAFWVGGGEENIPNASIPTGRGGDASLAALFGLFGTILVILLPIGIVVAILSPEHRKKILSYFMQAMSFVIVAMILSSVRDSFENREILPDSSSAADAGSVPFGSVIETPETGPPAGPGNAPEWAVVLVSTGAVIALALLARYGYNRFLKPSPLVQLGQDAQGALDSLRAGADVNDAIRRCYYEMSATLRKERSIQRKQAMTVREFEQQLEQSGLPRVYIRDLTRLFEKVRYGGQSPSASDERQAVECLSAIVKVASTGGGV